MATLNQTNAQAEREAANWFVRLSHQAITSEALRAFYAWRRTPAHDAAYSRMEALWAQSGQWRATPEVQRDVAAALARGAQRRRRRAWIKVALAPFSAIALASLAALYLIAWPPSQDYQTQIGEQRLLRLEDGSRVRLDTNTELKVRLRRDRRDLRLVRGQAFFDVAHDPTRPFVVAAAGARIRAVGTRFDVRIDGRQAKIALVDGAVDVTRRQDGQTRRWRLTAGQILAAKALPAPGDLAAATRWTTGHLEFQATPLAQAVAEVNRYSGTKLVLAAPDLAGSHVNGVFDAGDTPAFVNAVCELFNLTADPPRDGEIRLRPKA